MKTAIITIAGISSRFNYNLIESEKKHKIIYYEKEKEDTLLYHLLIKCNDFDRIILVGGNRYEDVKEYCEGLQPEIRDKIDLIYNEHYADLASGYSLYVGLKHMFDNTGFSSDEAIFIEGDLDVDNESFKLVVQSKSDVLTYSHEPIFSEKAVVLYRDEKGRYRYAFNSGHGLLKIQDAFSVILNSGQIWKFTDMNKLKFANTKFYNDDMSETNLRIVQNYIDQCESSDFELIGFKHWVNCNTREDYKHIVEYWRGEGQK